MLLMMMREAKWHEFAFISQCQACLTVVVRLEALRSISLAALTPALDDTSKGTGGNSTNRQQQPQQQHPKT